MKNVKKAVALVLSVVLTLSVLPIFASARTNTINDPIVYVRGAGGSIYEADGVTEVTHELDKSELPDKIKSVIFPYFVNCIAGGSEADWQAYYDKFEEVLRPIYDEWRPNDDGSVTDGSGLGKEDTDINNYKSNTDTVRSGNRYDSGDRRFEYDYRIDPFINADRLNEYIQNVKKSTKHNKVQLYSVCMGGNVTLTYLAKYGTKDVSSVLFDTNTSQGQASLIGFATGSLDFNGESIQRTVDDLTLKNKIKYTVDMDDTLLEFLQITLRMLNQYSVIDVLNGGLKPFIKKLNHGLLPQLFMASYGTSLGYWSQIGDEYFDEAIENTFGVKDYKTRYASLIEKIYKYHDEVGSRADEILNAAMADGVYVGAISKYGFNTVPVFGEISKEIGDERVACKYSSFGAKCALANETLPKNYIAKQTEKGLGKYISCDKMIDASTCISPDRTWFIKGVYHDCYSATYPVVDKFFDNNGNFTVNDDPKYPQFLIFDKESFDSNENVVAVPLTTENMNDTCWETGKKMDFTSPKSFVDTLTDWIVSVMKMFKWLMNFISEKLQNLTFKK